MITYLFALFKYGETSDEQTYVFGLDEEAQKILKTEQREYRTWLAETSEMLSKSYTDTTPSFVMAGDSDVTIDGFRIDTPMKSFEMTQLAKAWMDAFIERAGGNQNGFSPILSLTPLDFQGGYLSLNTAKEIVIPKLIALSEKEKLEILPKAHGINKISQRRM